MISKRTFLKLSKEYVSRRTPVKRGILYAVTSVFKSKTHCKYYVVYLVDYSQHIYRVSYYQNGKWLLQIFAVGITFIYNDCLRYFDEV